MKKIDLQYSHFPLPATLAYKKKKRKCTRTTLQWHSQVGCAAAGSARRTRCTDREKQKKCWGKEKKQPRVRSTLHQPCHGSLSVPDPTTRRVSVEKEGATTHQHSHTQGTVQAVCHSTARANIPTASNISNSDFRLVRPNKRAQFTTQFVCECERT